MIPKRINIMYQRQSKWVREKGKELGPSGFKLWYTGNLRENNSEGIVVDKDWKERLVEVKKLKPNMNLKTIGCIWDHQYYWYLVGSEALVKEKFWKDLVGMVRGTHEDFLRKASKWTAVTQGNL